MNQAEWNNFVLEHQGSFLQSWEWGELQREYGRKVWREQGAQIIRYELPANRGYFFSPYGPVIWQEEIINWLEENAAKEKCIFWRYEPKEKIDINARRVRDHHPSQTLVLDLRQSEETLLQQMHAKTRYNIHLAHRHGVAIKVSQDMREIEIFYELMRETAQRQKIRIHPKSYYQLMLHTLGDRGMLKMYLAEYQTNVLAVAVMIYFGQTVTYLHGAMSQENKNVMAPYLLHWRAMQEARQAGFSFYDFFGISDSPKWRGITRFKKGFGGREVQYAGTWELPLNNLWYKAYHLAKFLK